MENSLKILRIIWAALLAAVLFYAYLCSTVHVQAKPNPTVFRVLAVLAFVEAVGLLFVRNRFFSGAIAALQTEPQNQTALGKWRAGNIFSWAVSLCIGLYGLLLRYTGFGFRQVLPFLVAAFVLILLLPPRRLPVTG